MKFSLQIMMAILCICALIRSSNSDRHGWNNFPNDDFGEIQENSFEDLPSFGDRQEALDFTRYYPEEPKPELPGFPNDDFGEIKEDSIEELSPFGDSQEALDDNGEDFDYYDDDYPEEPKPELPGFPGWFRSLIPYKEPEPHHEKHKPHYEHPKPHHEKHEPHYDPPTTHYKEPEPHHEKHKPHYDPPKTHYKDPEPHHEKHEPHYDPPTTHYKEPEPHHEKHKPHHEKHKPHYEHPKPHHEKHEPHYDPPTTHYKEPEPHHEKHKPHHEKHKPHYEHPKPHHKKTGLDPHGKGKQCVDVSYYSFPTWVQEYRKCCKTVFKKHTHQREKKVCSDVTSLYCDVWPYTECEMKMYDKKVNITHWIYKHEPVYTCKKHYQEIVHKKKKPVCIKKPKKVCNSKWKILPSGEKVWDGHEDCKTIYVDDCTLKEVPEIIKVEKPHCTVTKKIPYMTIVPKKEILTVYKMECKVLKKNHCEAHTTHECKTIVYTESEEKPHKICDPTYVKVPKQHPVHKKKCLFMAHDGLGHETYKL